MSRRLQRILGYFTREIQDDYIRENFQRIREFFRDDAIIKGQFEFFTVTFASATTLTPLHGLSFTPKDVILLSVTDADSAAITWHWDDFSDTTIKVQADAACTIRAYIGRYEEN